MWRLGPPNRILRSLGPSLRDSAVFLCGCPQDVRVSCSMPSVKVLQMMQVACLAVGIGSGKWACFLQWTWIYRSAGGNLGFPMLSAELLGQLSCQTNRNLTEHTRACFKYRKHIDIDVKALTYFRICPVNSYVIGLPSGSSRLPELPNICSF